MEQMVNLLVVEIVVLVLLMMAGFAVALYAQRNHIEHLKGLLKDSGRLAPTTSAAPGATPAPPLRSLAGGG